MALNHVPFIFAGELDFEKDTMIIALRCTKLNDKIWPTVSRLTQLYVIEESVVYQ